MPLTSCSRDDDSTGAGLSRRNERSAREVPDRCQFAPEVVSALATVPFLLMLDSMKRARRKLAAAAGLVDGTELEARRQQRLQTVATLKQARTPLQVIEVAGRAAELAEAATAEAKRREPPARPS